MKHNSKTSQPQKHCNFHYFSQEQFSLKGGDNFSTSVGESLLPIFLSLKFRNGICILPY